MKITANNAFTALLATCIIVGACAIVYGLGWGLYHLSDGGSMAAVCILGSVAMVCATVIYLVVKENNGSYRVSRAHAEKQAERILRADRVVEHK